MFTSKATSDAYNKTLPSRSAHGTLIQNWHEESILRETTGLARNPAPTHIAKKHDELFIRPGDELQHIYQQGVKEDSFGRVFGKSNQINYTTEARHQFQNKQGYKERTQGKKYELIEKQFIHGVKSEIEIKNRRTAELSSQGDFNTTYNNQFVQKDIDVNTLGRKVMVDQNGNKLSAGCRDQDLLVDNGFLQRSQIASDEELRRTMIQGDYTKAAPYTFWSDKTNDGGVFYHSAASPSKSFGLNNSFVKTFSHYKQIKL